MLLSFSFKQSLSICTGLNFDKLNFLIEELLEFVDDLMEGNIFVLAFVAISLFRLGSVLNCIFISCCGAFVIFVGLLLG